MQIEYAILIGFFLSICAFIVFTIDKFLAFFLLLQLRIVANLSEYSFGVPGINAGSVFGILLIFFSFFIIFFNKKSKFFIPNIIPFYMLIISSIFSTINTNFYLSVLAQFFKIIAMVCLFIIPYNLIHDMKSGKKAIKYFSLISIIPIIIGFVQLISGGGLLANVHLGVSFRKIMSTYSHPNGYAFFLGLIVFAVFVNIMIRDKNYRYYYFLLIACLTSILFTYSRSVWISLTFCILIIFFPIKKVRLPIIAFSLLIALLSSSLIIDRFSDIINPNSTQNYYEETNSLEFRLQLTKRLFQNAFPIHPFLGFGLGSSIRTAGKYANMAIVPHNDYMLFLIETGLIGLLFFLWFIFGNLFFLIKNIKYYGKNIYFSGLTGVIIYFTGIIVGTNQMGVIPTGGMWFCLYGILLKCFKLSVREDNVLQKSII